MNVLPIDFVALVAVIMGISIVLIPVAGLTARYALKPIVEALGKYFQGKGTEESVRIVERRLALLEQQLDEVQVSINRLVEVSRFDAKLRDPAPVGSLSAASSEAGGLHLDQDVAAVQDPGDGQPEQHRGPGKGKGAV